ncbi:sugar ABC transporter substrate-binding protein [Nonomuraea soli]|uniref:Arabinogalactan oligomer/maltooligosaccharide transport system substrate-binding protein n=1 Tax=Nonomuraea soli TaxID=1032476 RepID=A0A7W0HP83_9ACTN|nr:maltose ABC transporter substrate-binding protein [Nonomuraea soli]MBA2890603.1 arabinogalactan oligomer/maltooligosaccharide transport system substrate-binding protein [Nonomuraea soli]
MRIRALATLAGLALAAAACGNSAEAPAAAPTSAAPAPSSAAPAAGGKLVIWSEGAKRTAALKPFAEQFGAENGVTVEIKEITENPQQTFVTASQQGSGPDVMVGAHDWIGNMVQNGAVEPVNLTDEQKAGFNPVAVKAVTFNGQVYGAPYAVENLALIRNTDLVADAPATFDEVAAKGLALKKDGKVKEALCLQVAQVGDAYHAYPLFSSAGGSLFGATATGDPDPKQVQIGTGDSVKAWGKLGELGKKGVLKTSITPENSIPTFAKGDCAFLVSGPWAMNDVRKSGLKYDISAIPAFEGGKPATPFVGVQAFFVAAKGQNKTLAQEFVTNYVTNTDVAKALYDADPRPPALTAAMDLVKGNDPDLAKFLDAGKDGLPMPAIPEMSAIWEPFGIAEASVIKGGDAAKAAGAAQKAVEKSLAK